jgi:hypothetical protein
MFSARQGVESMRNTLDRTRTQDLSKEELEIIDELIFVLVKIDTLEDKLSVFDLAYILQLILSEKDLKSLKEIL